MVKVSFDADGTLLQYPSVQAYAKELVQRGIEVWIVTRRYDSLERYTPEFNFKYKILDLEAEHKYLFTVADECGIKRENIKFMNMDDKWKYFKNSDFIWHLDDDSYEIKDINKHTKTKGISVVNNWKHKCEKLLKWILNK